MVYGLPKIIANQSKHYILHLNILTVWEQLNSSWVLKIVDIYSQSSTNLITFRGDSIHQEERSTRVLLTAISLYTDYANNKHVKILNNN